MIYATCSGDYPLASPYFSRLGNPPGGKPNRESSEWRNKRSKSFSFYYELANAFEIK